MYVYNNNSKIKIMSNMVLYFLQIVLSSGLDIKRSMDFINKFIFGVLFQKRKKKKVISFVLPGTNYLFQRVI